MRNPTPDDHDAARRLIASAFDWTAQGQCGVYGYQHDHDEEFAWLLVEDSLSKPPATARQSRKAAPPVQKPEKMHIEQRHAPAPPTPAPSDSEHPGRPRDDAYWDETADLVLDYFELLAGPDDAARLVDGFIDCLKRSPGARRLYEEGDDMTRARLVEWFLKIMR
jgi:hypothetical protein